VGEGDAVRMCCRHRRKEGRSGMAQTHRSSSHGGTGAMMLAGPGDSMNERAPSTRERQRKRYACNWGRGS
jgi:hypothetical protein